MGFRDAKRQVLDCLASGNILHELRGSIDVKTQYEGQEWYIKRYYIEPNSVFVSVHH